MTFKIDGVPFPLPVEIIFDNRMAGSSYGLELAGNWDVSDDWGLKLACSWLEVD